MLSGHTGHQRLLKLLLKSIYSLVCRYPGLFQHFVQQLNHRILLIALHHGFLASFMSVSMLDTTGLARLSEFPCGIVDGIAVGVPQGTIISMHGCDCKSYVCLPLSHRLKYGFHIGGIHLVQVCQNFSGNSNRLMKTSKVPSLEMLQAVVHLSQHLT